MKIITIQYSQTNIQGCSIIRFCADCNLWIIHGHKMPKNCIIRVLYRDIVKKHTISKTLFRAYIDLSSE